MKHYRIIVSTVSFGKHIEITSGDVYAPDADYADNLARVFGHKDLYGYKFERVEEIA